ncbi:MAG: ATP-binding protein, partial [Patescibacteria group bacterium]
IMKFFNRQEQIKQIKEICLLGQKRAQFTTIFGRRRIGKTRLILEATKKHKNVLYFFIAKKTSGFLLEDFTKELQQKLNLIIPSKINSFEDLIKFLFQFSQKQSLIVIFDEFQNFQYVDSSVFSLFQKYWDLNKEKSKISLFFIGSMHTLMKKIFFSSSEPLFGRAINKFQIKYISINWVIKILKNFKLYSPSNILHFYSIFGGVPKYLELIEEKNLKGKKLDKILEKLFFEQDAILAEEGKSILVEEFGKNYQNYFSVLEAIARGKTKRSEIVNITGILNNSLGIYLDELEKYYELIERRIPIFTNRHFSKLGSYNVSDNFFRFWFRYVSSQKATVESGNYKEALNFTLKDLTNLEGFVFEQLIKELLVEKNKNEKFLFNFTQIGSFWTRKNNQIDIVCANAKTKEIFFGECKLNSKRINLKLIQELKEKAKNVKWNLNNRKEYFGIFTLDKPIQKLKNFLKKEKIYYWNLENLY